MRSSGPGSHLQPNLPAWHEPDRPVAPLAEVGSQRCDDASSVGHGLLSGTGLRGESLPAVRDSGVHVQFDGDPGPGQVLGVGDVLVAEDV